MRLARSRCRSFTIIDQLGYVYGVLTPLAVHSQPIQQILIGGVLLYPLLGTKCFFGPDFDLFNALGRCVDFGQQSQTSQQSTCRRAPNPSGVWG